jgi:type II secretory pathway component GspD/PulD (secretin)
MTPPIQFRLASVARCTAAFAIVILSVAAIAQTPSVELPKFTHPTSTASNQESTTVSAPSKNQLREADNAYLEGARLLERNDLTGAQIQFEKAVKLNPSNHDYIMADTITREHRVTELVQLSGKARLLGQTQKADALLGEARLLDPQNPIVTQHLPSGVLPVSFTPEIAPWIKRAPILAGPITLLPNSDIRSFHIHSDLQDVLRQVISSYGIRPVFDDSVAHETVRFDLDSVPYAQAVHILLQMSGLFSVALDSTSIFIAKDTPENRQRLERQLQETINIPGMTAQEMNDLGNVVRNIFDVKQLTIEKSLGDLVLRAPEDTLKAVNLTLADLIDGGSEVLIELKLYSIDKTRQRNIGAQPPQQLGVYSVASEAANVVNQNQTLVNQAIAQGLVKSGASNIDIALALIGSGLVQSSLLSSTIDFVGGGLTLTGITSNVIPTFNLALNSSDSRVLDDIRIRVGDRQTADFRIGTRYPITTSTYTTGATANSSALAGININGASASSLLSQLTGSSAGVTIPQIQYEDLGLTLKATPTVQKTGSVSMHLDLKIEALSGSSLNNIPILASRQFVSDITVDDGKPAMVVSMVSRSESAAVSGIPGLGELPGFQTATADTIAETDSSELVLLVTPHVVRRRSNTIAGPRIALNFPQEPD